MNVTQLVLLVQCVRMIEIDYRFLLVLNELFLCMIADQFNLSTESQNLMKGITVRAIDHEVRRVVSFNMFREILSSFYE